MPASVPAGQVAVQVLVAPAVEQVAGMVVVWVVARAVVPVVEWAVALVVVQVVVQVAAPVFAQVWGLPLRARLWLDRPHAPGGVVPSVATRWNPLISAPLCGHSASGNISR